MMETMSEIKKHGYDKACYKEIHGSRIYLYKGRDLIHGRGWFCHLYTDYTKPLFGFGKNKFEAFRNVFKEQP